MTRTLEDRLADFLRFAIPAAGLLGLGALLVWGSIEFWQYELEQERLSQQRCLDRGGKLSVYAAGFPHWACEGMTRL